MSKVLYVGNPRPKFNTDYIKMLLGIQDVVMLEFQQLQGNTYELVAFEEVANAQGENPSQAATRKNKPWYQQFDKKCYKGK